MGRENVRERDERWETLKRRVIALSRLEGDVFVLAEGVHVGKAARVELIDPLIDAMKKGPLERAKFESHVELERPLVLVTRALLAVAQRDLRALATTPARALARERKKMLARHGDVDEAWLRAKARRLDELAVRLDASLEAPWFDHALAIIRAVQGEGSAHAIVGAHARLVAEGAARRQIASERLDALLSAMTEGNPDPIAERLEHIGELPGRARRARALAVLHEALGTSASVDAQILAEKRKPWIEALREVGHALVRAHASPRSASARDEVESMLAWYGLAFPAGDLTMLGPPEVKRAIEKKPIVAELHRVPVTIAQVLALAELPMESWQRVPVGKLVAEGLEIEHVAAMCSEKRIGELARFTTVRAARAYATWAVKLVPHFQKLGVRLELNAELFANLPKNEDLGVLALCLVDVHFDRKESDPLSTLDATLGLFQKLPSKVSTVLARLRGTDPGAGRRAFPEVAEWIGEDELLDRYVHLSRIAGQPVVLTARLREDFDHADKSAREQAHLEAMSVRSSRQEGRLRALRAVDRSRSAAPRGRTRRRLAARVEELLPIAYRRELDAVFKDILREAWSIDIQRLTPAWRDAVRFWLVVDQNRDLLGQLLRAAARAPGRDIKRMFPRNEEWIEKARGRFTVDAWLAPRRQSLAGHVISVEEDPLEVLRMGIPFNTCLSLTDGCNAASTVVNAVDANKRIIYVRTNEGAVVARKLLVIDKKDQLVGYNFYLSMRGGAESDIRRAVDGMCREIARAAGIELSNVSDGNDRLHGTFWYDDGAVPFDEDVDVAKYCTALGLTAPVGTYDALVTEAKGRAAMMDGDVERAIGNLTRWDRGAANVALGRFVVDRLGEKEAIRRATDLNALVPPLMWRMADDGVSGVLRFLGFATRLDEETVGEELDRLLARFPDDPRITRALGDLALRAARVFSTTGYEALAWRALGELERRLHDLTTAFDAFDRVSAAYEHVRGIPQSAVERLYLRAPDPELVVEVLRSKKRSKASHDAALCVAARHELPGGAAALERLVAHRPVFAAHWRLSIARLRHRLAVTGQVRLGHYGDLATKRPEVMESITDWSKVELGHLAAWDYAYLARHPSPVVRGRLLSDAHLSPRLASRSLESLALMGDHAAVREVADSLRKPVPPKTAASTLTTIEECVRAALSIRKQVAACERGELLSPLPHAVDRGLAELAMKVLLDEAPGSKTTAREILSKSSGVLPWWLIVERSFEKGDVDSATEFATRSQHWGVLSPALVKRAWADQRLRAPLLQWIATDSTDTWAACAWSLERTTQIAGLFEAVALQRLASMPNPQVWDVETPDQLRTVIKLLAFDAPPSAAVGSYLGFQDDLTAAMFLKAFPKLSVERAARIRDAAKAFTWNGSRGTARKTWLEATRLREGPASPIER